MQKFKHKNKKIDHENNFVLKIIPRVQESFLLQIDLLTSKGYEYKRKDFWNERLQKLRGDF